MIKSQGFTHSDKPNIYFALPLPPPHTHLETQHKDTIL